MCKTLSEILDKHINELKAGHNELLETDIKAWVAEEIIGQDVDVDTMSERGIRSAVDEELVRNNLKAEQRKRLQLDNLESE